LEYRLDSPERIAIETAGRAVVYIEMRPVNVALSRAEVLVGARTAGTVEDGSEVVDGSVDPVLDKDRYIEIVPVVPCNDYLVV